MTKVFGLVAAPVRSMSRGGWWPIIREPFTGAWQQNQEITAETSLTYSAVFACVTLIASDIAKLGLRLVEVDEYGVWTETTASAFSPVLRRPNRYQNRIQFVTQWMISKLIHGNTYVLKERDGRGVVVALYVLDPTRVTVLVSPAGDVFYELKRDDLAGLPTDQTVVVPAREIIHDKMVPLYHPLVGVSPIHACGIAALQGLSIQNTSTAFFRNGSQPSGILTTPQDLTDEQAADVKSRWQAGYTGDNVGQVALLSHGLTYEQMAVNAADAQLIEQLQWSATTVCSCFHIQPYMISIGDPPPYANIEPLTIQYYSQCLQEKIENLELSLDEGLELPAPYGTEFNLDDLMRMDSLSKNQAASTAISSGGMTINEARKKYYDLAPVPGGHTPYMQQQYWPLDQLGTRPPPAAPTLPPAAADEDDEDAPTSAEDLMRAHEKAMVIYAAA
ncbi:MAG: phage portal protein [Planctomycetota bacterium]|nr:MAG: phage portal protein [Planctomycetota bacterium]